MYICKGYLKGHELWKAKELSMKYKTCHQKLIMVKWLNYKEKLKLCKKNHADNIVVADKKIFNYNILHCMDY